MRIAQSVFATTLALAATTTFVGAQGTPKSTDRAVTISGCVVAGEAADSFMLNDVKQLSGTWMAPVPKDSNGAPVLYWLKSTNGLAERVGKRVEVVGTVDPDDTKAGETKVTTDPDDTKDKKTEMSSAGRSVTTKVDSNPAVAKAPEGAQTTKVTTPAAVVYSLRVKSVRTVAGTCLVK